MIHNTFVGTNMFYGLWEIKINISILNFKFLFVAHTRNIKLLNSDLEAAKTIKVNYGLGFAAFVLVFTNLVQLVELS